MRYGVRDRESGWLIDYVDSREEGEEMIARFEAEDKAEGIYEPDFYEVFEEEEEKMIELNGEKMDFDLIVHYMDAEVAEMLHCGGITTKQEFVNEYCKAHFEKFGEKFTIN